MTGTTDSLQEINAHNKAPELVFKYLLQFQKSLYW
jgi:hypothetical protein